MLLQTYDRNSLTGFKPKISFMRYDKIKSGLNSVVVIGTVHNGSYDTVVFVKVT